MLSHLICNHEQSVCFARVKGENLQAMTLTVLKLMRARLRADVSWSAQSFPVGISQESLLNLKCYPWRLNSLTQAIFYFFS